MPPTLRQQDFALAIIDPDTRKIKTICGVCSQAFGQEKSDGHQSPS